MTETAASPLLDPNAEITHAVVRHSLPERLWALYGRTRAGLGGLSVGYVWRDAPDGWRLAVAAGGRHIASIGLTTDPLMGETEIGQDDTAALLSAPELQPEARSAIEVAALDGDVRRIRWPLRDDAAILGFISLVRARAALQ